MFKPIDPEPFLKIFEISKKSELVKHCKEITIHSSDFATTVFACDAGAMPWLHKISYRDFVPEHLKPTDKLGKALAGQGIGPLNDEARKEFVKIEQLFKDRRYLVGHIFYKHDLSQWHFFYFDQRDFDTRNNHWEHGAHIHLLNHLWPNLKADTLWQTFNAGNPKLSGSLHIRFSDPRPENNQVF